MTIRILKILSHLAARRLRVMKLAVCVLASLATGCKSTSESESIVPVKVKEIKWESIKLSTRYSASIEPFQTTSLAFKLAGTVATVYRPPNLNRDVQVGDTLSKGTIIAELDEGDLRRAKAGAEARVAQLEARVATAKDNLDIATRNFERFVKSAGSVSKTARDEADTKRVIAAGELASAEHALADARVQLDQASDDYANRQLIVPFDQATVAEKRLEPGERVQSGNPVFKLIDISKVHVRFGVPDTMIGDPAAQDSSADRIYLGQKLRITSDALADRTLEAVVTKIAPQADPKTRTFLTELTLANQQLPDGQPLLRAGMIVTVVVGAVHDRRALLVPMTAIHRGSSANELIVYEASRENDREVAKARKVSAGGVYDNQVEILPEASALQAGSKVIVTTAERLTDSQAVRIEHERDLP